VPQHGNCVIEQNVLTQEKKKYYCYMDQIQPKKYFMG